MKSPGQMRPDDMATLVVAGVVAVAVVLLVAYFAVRSLEAERENKALKAAVQKSKAVPADRTATPSRRLPRAAEMQPLPPANDRTSLKAFLALPKESQALIWLIWVDKNLHDLAKDPGLRRAYAKSCLSKADAAVELMSLRQRESMSLDDLMAIVDQSLAGSIAAISLVEPTPPPSEATVFDRVSRYVDLMPIDRALIWEQYIAKQHPELADSKQFMRVHLSLLAASVRLETMTADATRSALLIEFFQAASDDVDVLLQRAAEDDDVPLDPI